MSTSTLETVIPKDQIKQNKSDHPLGNGGRQIIEAYSEEDISDVLRYANEHEQTVNIISGGTKRGYGGTLEQADILLSLAGYKGIIEHSVGDLTLTVRPGTTVKEISDQLAQSGQCLALDPSWPELATIGGVISANESGAKRLLYGSARDHVIGTRIVYADGHVIRTGGKVVKNVAGYDMNKLFIGAMGTLGIISEITLKLRPLPKYEALSLLHFPETREREIYDFAKRIMDSMMEPVSLEVLTPATAEKLTGKQRYTLAIAFEDQKKAVSQQEKWVADHLPPDVEQTVLYEQEASEWWNAFRRQGPNGHNDETDDANTRAALKIGSLPSDVPGNLKKAEELAEVHHVAIEAHGGAGHGISRVYVNGYAEDVIIFIKALRSEVEKRDGYVVCTHLPFVLREEADVWGEKPVYFSLLDGIKRTNDPKKLLNRQRFVGGI
ncbi:FAD-binding oxidoreductase [Lentibacillus amyloliquefaciens]|uniref:Lactate dehydrogenase n=1 Tax=Lentibacillus amyloliquefaciens TaxID=1472767 RepID=A0A0U4FHJ5_9BACI|nr:FAD-binding oxidoreductase [Lentibacillus amyloliquefaciens]ALX49965.1 lactate dehydrogenase [Lentibacillus amyloliquefaciens]